MSILRALVPFGRSLVTEDFRRGDPERADAEAFVEAVDLGRDVPLAALRGVVVEAMKRYEADAWKSDAWLGPRVHATLRLTRREAADKRIWEYLTVVDFPDYVRWRWKNLDNPEKAVPQDRFLGEDSKNAFARLWWATELTRNGSDYRRSEIALGISRFYVSWQQLILMHHRAAALAVVDFLGNYRSSGTTDAQGQAMAKAANVALRTVCLDALASTPPTDADAVREWIAEDVDETTMIDDLPLGPDEEAVSEVEIAKVRKFLDDLAERIQLAGFVKPGRRQVTADKSGLSAVTEQESYAAELLSALLVEDAKIDGLIFEPDRAQSRNAAKAMTAILCNRIYCKSSYQPALQHNTTYAWNGGMFNCRNIADRDYLWTNVRQSIANEMHEIASSLPAAYVLAFSSPSTKTMCVWAIPEQLLYESLSNLEPKEGGEEYTIKIHSDKQRIEKYLKSPNLAQYFREFPLSDQELEILTMSREIDSLVKNRLSTAPSRASVEWTVGGPN